MDNGEPMTKAKDDPTVKIPAQEVDESEEPTIPRATSPETLAENPPTLKLPDSWTAHIEPERAERTVELTSDALPPELRQAPLPFVPPSEAQEVVDSEAQEVVDSEEGREETRSDAAVARVATIAAEMTAEPPATVLERHGLTPDSWSELELGCVVQLAAEAKRGDTTLRDAYDDAYLEARAAHRGPFDLQSFAELRVELESGTVADSSLGMAEDIADAMRFYRVWQRSIAADPAGARQLEEAIDRARARRARA
jgi:hypothetical protein